MASGAVLTGPAMSLTVALIRATLLKPFLQESRRACHSVKPGQRGKVTTLPPSACAGGGGGGVQVQCSGFVVSLIRDPPMSLWFPCQSALMERTAVMLLHILISCSRTVTRRNRVCLASADQETTAVFNIDGVSPVLGTLNSTYPRMHRWALYCLNSIKWCRDLSEVNFLWLVCSWEKKPWYKLRETPSWKA